MLEVMSVSKRFGENEAVRGVSFTINKGESFGLLGPNGAGKSTTISMISGLLERDSGRITIKGIDVRENPTGAKALMGVVPQDIALYPTLSARENLLFWGRMYGLKGKDLAVRVDEALDIVSLRERQKDRIETYSGGMKRRINIAASLLHRPELLIMDEPTVGIDPQSRNNILETVKRLNGEKGMTILYTSHYMEEVEYLCNKVAIIDHGKVIAQGTLEEVRQLVGRESTVKFKVTDPDEALVEKLGKIPGVKQAMAKEDQVETLVEGAAEALPQLMEAIRDSGRKVISVLIEEPNLESVFLRLTGRALRD